MSAEPEKKAPDVIGTVVACTLGAGLLAFSLWMANDFGFKSGVRAQIDHANRIECAKSGGAIVVDPAWGNERCVERKP